MVVSVPLKLAMVASEITRRWAAVLPAAEHGHCYEFAGFAISILRQHGYRPIARVGMVRSRCYGTLLHAWVEIDDSFALHSPRPFVVDLAPRAAFPRE
jgi:hypothetical protein